MAMSNRPSLSINKNSQAIAKTKPKIRIIHIFAPEVIKTDVGNFRELVQRLTGKPSAEKHCDNKMPTIAPRHQDTTRSNVGLSSDKPKTRSKPDDYQSGERLVMKEQEQVGLCRAETSGGYLGGFSDLECLVSEFAQIPFPLDDTHIHGYEQLQL
ncbi:VQ motif-containing protein 17-like [Prosopis cineraria]|uniref:VQ motif-containing protein 17-like n=1 Tax=Prosopis cineraria TaxID=364024 RepID=UPI00240FE203|nr:VQ motif-containing protein 17-like [Prosopis cineraria]